MLACVAVLIGMAFVARDSKPDCLLWLAVALVVSA